MLENWMDLSELRRDREAELRRIVAMLSVAEGRTRRERRAIRMLKHWYDAALAHLDQTGKAYRPEPEPVTPAPVPSDWWAWVEEQAASNGRAVLAMKDWGVDADLGRTSARLRRALREERLGLARARECGVGRSERENERTH